VEIEVQKEVKKDMISQEDEIEVQQHVEDNIMSQEELPQEEEVEIK
jgi:hypothetical protein